MSPNPFESSQRRGFALVVTLSLMILLTVIAVGLLALGSISLRVAAGGDSLARAEANARLALLLALGELQKQAGDDRRITADASLDENATRPRLVGVWDSWSPNFAASPTQTKPDYPSVKAGKFRTWLSSSPDPEVPADAGWQQTAAGPDWVPLFTPARDGVDISAPRIPTPQGALAWSVIQENTRAKVNIGGPEKTNDHPNIDVQAQARPSLALAAGFKEPSGDWNARATRVISTAQITLDKDISADAPADAAAKASYTAYGAGLLTNVVKGGLKTDLSLGFEMPDGDFTSASWGSTPNPFRSPNSSAGFSGPTSYGKQQPLFRPLLENPIISITTSFDPASVANRYYAAGVPTFDHLRSYYRIPHHLYGTAEHPVVAERGPDHIAVKLASSPPGGANWAPGNPPQGKSSTLSIRPVLDRLIYLMGFSIGSDEKVRLIITPIVTLWNPYNADLEIDGAVAYPWIDVPFTIVWTINGVESRVSMSQLMGKQFSSVGHGRSVDPYFFCEITSDGDGSNTNNQPIRFKPGEVRVFVPASPVPTDFVRTAPNYTRTVRLRPVENSSGVNKRGGLSISMNQNPGVTGFDTTVPAGGNVKCEIQALNNSYHYFVSLEDSTRVKNRADNTRGETIADVQVLNFSSAVDRITSATQSYNALKNAPVVFGVLETYHRVARQPNAGQAVADLIYTTNPRHPSINHQLANGTFTTAPHYESILRAVGNFDGALQTTPDGRDSLWGASQSNPSGKSVLPFFEIPREPLVSLAAFQHADLASSTYSSSYQFANSWASPYISRSRVAQVVVKSGASGAYQLPVYDQTYLANEALWDGYFFSSAAPRLQPASSGSPAGAWKTDIASERVSLEKVLGDFVGDPLENPLANGRMRLVRGNYDDKELVKRLTEPAGCTRIAAHLMVDGAFNVNSTDTAAWVAVLAGLRGKKFEVDGSPPDTSRTAFPRFRHPTGEANDNWNGYRTLDDTQIRTLAENIVKQVRQRGPFLSLAEFVNRRVDATNGALGLSGAIQSAIDAARFNDSAKQAPFTTGYYPADSQNNIVRDTGVGIPGYLTQADVLQSLAPALTARSDTFTLRGYGEARDRSGQVVARACCEAVVQRMPEFIDPADAPETKLASVSTVNQRFGRRFEIVSFRRVPLAELR